MAKDEIWNYISGRKEEEVDTKISENYTYMVGVIAEYVQLGGIQPLDDIIDNIRKDVLKIVNPPAEVEPGEAEVEGEAAEAKENAEVAESEETAAPVVEEAVAEVPEVKE